jgi:hypothetical protein
MRELQFRTLLNENGAELELVQKTPFRLSRPRKRQREPAFQVWFRC